MDNCIISWAEIDLRAIRNNIAEIRRLVSPSTKLMAVVKSNAYGNGMLEIAEVCQQEGVSYLGVATPDEAVTLREAGINANILLLGYMPVECAATMVENDIEVTVFSLDTAEVLSQAAARLNHTARLHIKIDTGMGRIGFTPNDSSLESIKVISRMPGIVLQGILSHLATADHDDKSFAKQQVEIFKSYISQLAEAGIDFPIKHIANSAAIIDMPESHFDMVRSGIITYGLYPSAHVNQDKLKLIPAMRLKSTISYLKTISAGQSVSYGRTFISQQEIKVATVAIGYADGYNRLLSNRGWACVKGKRVPLIGAVCMDQCMFDVSAIEDVRVGDEIIMFGRPEDGVTADDLANAIGTINYEIICAPSSRVDRIYLK
ncbi:MAG: alanine racemase [Syntrophomonas sp.]|nr:alanine racemase [Syntrophomonas sp.]